MSRRMGNRTLNHFMRGIGKQMAKQNAKKKLQKQKVELDEKVLKEQADRNFKNMSRIHIGIMSERQKDELK